MRRRVDSAPIWARRDVVLLAEIDGGPQADVTSAARRLIARGSTGRASTFNGT